MPDKRFLEGDVRAIGRGGDAVVETPRGVVFVPGALPGERIELEPRPSKRGVERGRLRRIVREAPGRRAPPCAHALRCGGCPLMIADRELQRAIKLGFLQEACRGLPGAEETEIAWSASPADIGYRGRARLAWDRDAIGYRQLHSKRVTDIAECIVLTEPLRLAWNEVRSCLGSSLRGTGEIELQQTHADRVMVSLNADDAQPPSLFDACEALSARAVIAGVTLRTGEIGHPATWGQTHIVIEATDGTLCAPIGGFLQANEAVNTKLVEAVVELARPQGMRVLELYCGVGNLTVGLAAHAETLVAVEQDARAVQACRDNLKRRGLQGRVVLGDANQPPKGRYDVVVLDPPRQGARALFERSHLLPGPKRVIYVSCDTATLARDLRLATGKGYQIDRVMAFDMFPQTAHLESLVRLVRS